MPQGGTSGEEEMEWVPFGRGGRCFFSGRGKRCAGGQTYLSKELYDFELSKKMS